MPATHRMQIPVTSITELPKKVRVAVKRKTARRAKRAAAKSDNQS